MRFRSVGKSGLKVSAVSIGGWLTFGATVDSDRTASILKAALDAGINFIDLADVYARGKAEEFTGRFIKGLERSSLVISSKVYWPMSDDPNDQGLSRKHIFESVNKSLKRLGTDYLDMYFCHRFDEHTPLEETVRAMDDLVRAGKVLYWGTSVFSAEQLLSTHRVAEYFRVHAPAVEQPRYNLLDRDIETGVIPAAVKLGMGLVVWSPLAQGMLTGKYNDGKPKGSRGAESGWLDRVLTDANIERTRKFVQIAAAAGTTPSRLALAWCLRHETVASVITGATSPEQVRDNVAAVDFKIDDALSLQLDEVFPRQKE